MTSSNIKIQALLERIRQQKAQETAQQQMQPMQSVSVANDHCVTYDRYGNLITYNEKQQEFIDLVRAGKSAVLIGAAGTGKTTCMRGTIETLIASSFIPQIQEPHKHLHVGTPGIVVISYTRRAVSNIKRVLSDDIKGNAITYHKLLEYEPVFYEVVDPETGKLKNTMRFEPARHAMNKLPSSIRCIIVEESSMLSVEYWNLLVEAMAHGVQVIFLGDIYQLPPVFGAAILGYKLNTLPVVELTEVYRQAMNSPIISYAHKIKNGEGFMLPEKLVVENEDGKVTFHPWKKKLTAEDALDVSAKFFRTALDVGVWNPAEDIILMPFNKAYGTIELNKHLASFLAAKQDNPVYEIIAGFNKLYLRVGERVMYDKEDAVITAISRNALYLGAAYQDESTNMNYWGQLCVDEAEHHAAKLDESEDDFDVDFYLEQMAKQSTEDRIHAASHIITLVTDVGECEIVLDTAAELNKLLLGYALTVHKAQGSEWRKVFLLFSHLHATMLSRELLYTAITRAREEVYCICERDTFVKGVKSQKIKGTTLAEKAEYFKGKALEPGVIVL